MTNATKLANRFDRRQTKAARVAFATLSFKERFIIDTLLERRARLSVCCTKRIGDDHILIEFITGESPKGRVTYTDHERSHALAPVVKALRARGWLRFIPHPGEANSPNPFGHVWFTEAAETVLELATGSRRW